MSHQGDGWHRIAPTAPCKGLSCSTSEPWQAGSVRAGARAMGQGWAGQHRSRSPPMLLLPPLAPERGCSPALIISLRAKSQELPGAELFGVRNRAEMCPVKGNKWITAAGMETPDGKQ